MLQRVAKFTLGTVNIHGHGPSRPESMGWKYYAMCARVRVRDRQGERERESTAQLQQ